MEFLPRNEVSNVDKAIDNAEVFAREVIAKLTPGDAKPMEVEA
ncbi:Stability/partitioning determinant [Pseudomonas amygdali pv. morsprunorum]|nr:Stability/partitioning determinant [Pseudomonas amygdali pv. morsprunorum]